MIGFITRRRHDIFCVAALLLATATSAFLAQPSARPCMPPALKTTIGLNNGIPNRSLKENRCRHSLSLLPSRRGIRSSSKVTTKNSNDDGNNDAFFDGKTTAALVGGQSLLIIGSIAVAALIGTPKLGLGPGFDLSWPAFSMGVLYTLPLGLLAAALDVVEDKFPALQDVTKATQRSVLALLGGKFKPIIAFVTSLALGCVAGLGEEMLFRGVLQYELTSWLGQGVAVAISSIIFGALHAVTPLYAILASLASVYFGVLYIVSSNLAVPITAHAVYDLLALLFAHWTVSRLSADEQTYISQWQGPGDENNNK